FDIGIKNPAVAYIEYDKTNNKIDLIHGRKYNWKNWKRELKVYLENIILYFNINEPINICIEKQYKGNQLLSIMYFIIGYFTGLGHNVIICKPCTQGMYIRTRTNRKQFSM